MDPRGLLSTGRREVQPPRPDSKFPGATLVIEVGGTSLRERVQLNEVLKPLWTKNKGYVGAPVSVPGGGFLFRRKEQNRNAMGKRRQRRRSPPRRIFA